MYKSTLVLAVFTPLVLSGCIGGGKGLDHPLDVSKPLAEQQKNLNEALAQMTPEQRQAMASVDALMNKNFPSFPIRDVNVKTVRDYAKDEMKLLNDVFKGIYDETKLTAAADKAGQAQLDRVHISNVHLSNTQDEFSKGLALTWTAKNDSTVPLSSLTLKAMIYIDGNKTPAADPCTIRDAYTSGDENGLKPGQSSSRSAFIDGMFSCQGWTTLAILDSKSRRIDLEVVNAQDFSDNNLVANPGDVKAYEDVVKEMAELKSDIAIISK